MATTEHHPLEHLDAKTDAGPGTGHAATQHGVETGAFDREISLKGIFWSAAVLLILAVLAHGLMWALLRGFGNASDRKDPKLSPIEVASPQPAEFPEPRLQTHQEQDLADVLNEERLRLDQAAWVSRPQGVVRVPVDVAIEVIARRGVAPLGDAPGATPQAPAAAGASAPAPSNTADAAAAPAPMGGSHP